MCTPGAVQAHRPPLSLPCSRRYRYTLDDLYPLMNALKLRAESYNEWASNVSEALEAKVNKKKSMWFRECDASAGGGSQGAQTREPQTGTRPGRPVCSQAHRARAGGGVAPFGHLACPCPTFRTEDEAQAPVESPPPWSPPARSLSVSTLPHAVVHGKYLRAELTRGPPPASCIRGKRGGHRREGLSSLPRPRQL